jgi:hypothetical protein
MHASWFGSLRPTGYKVAARVSIVPRQRAPLGRVIPTATSWGRSAVVRCVSMTSCTYPKAVMRGWVMEPVANFHAARTDKRRIHRLGPICVKTPPMAPRSCSRYGKDVAAKTQDQKACRQ